MELSKTGSFEKNKKLAETTKDLLEEVFTNVEVELVGNGEMSAGERANKEKEISPDVCFEIQYAEDSPNIDIVYRDGDNRSSELASLQSAELMTVLEIQNVSAGTDLEKFGRQVDEINNYAEDGAKFVSSFIRVGTAVDSNNEESKKKFAEAMVYAVEDYMQSNHEGYESETTVSTYETASIRSRLVNMIYVKPETFEKHLKRSNVKNIEDAPLNEFTMDEATFGIVTTSYSCSGGRVQISENTPIQLKPTMQKYITPFTYYFHYYVDTDVRGFAEELAAYVLYQSEFVVALQDNVTTTSVNGKAGTEKDNLSVDLTYVKTWFVEAYKNNSFYSGVLTTKDGKKLQDRETLRDVSFPGNFTSEEVKDENGNTTVTVTCDYDPGETTVLEPKGQFKVDPNTGQIKDRNPFYDIYNKYGFRYLLREDWVLDLIAGDYNCKKNLLDVTRYILKDLSGADYGIDYLDYEAMFQLEHFEVTAKLTGAGGLIQGDTIEETIWFTLLGMGLNKYQVAGILGNMEQESSFNTAAVNEIGASGICQWMNERYDGLVRYAASKGKDWTDLEIQLKYLMAEITPGGVTPDGESGFATYQFLTQSAADRWAGAASPEDAADAFFSGFERAGDSSGPDRQSNARKYYDMFKDKDPPTTFTGSGKFFDPTRGFVYHQGSDDFKDVYFGGGYTFSGAGCGACAVAMCVSDLMGQEIRPDTLWNEMNGPTVFGADGAMSWAYPGAVAAKYRITISMLRNRYKCSSTSTKRRKEDYIFTGYNIFCNRSSYSLLLCNRRK